MSDIAANKLIVAKLVEAINAQDWDALPALVAPGFKRHSAVAGEPAIESRDELLDFLRGEVETFPDAFETIEDMIAEDDRVAVRHRFTGTQHGALGPYPPSGRVMSAVYLAIYRLEESVICESWSAWDNLNGLVQLGHLRPLV